MRFSAVSPPGLGELGDCQLDDFRCKNNKQVKINVVH